MKAVRITIDGNCRGAALLRAAAATDEIEVASDLAGFLLIVASSCWGRAAALASWRKGADTKAAQPWRIVADELQKAAEAIVQRLEALR